MGKMLHYKEILTNMKRKEESIKEEFLSEQKIIAKNVFIENFQFGEQVIVKDKKHMPIVIRDVDFSKFEEKYFIETIEEESRWRRYMSGEEKYEKTFVLTSKQQDNNSLPICIQVVYYPKMLEVYNKDYNCLSLGLLYSSKVEVYVYVLDSCFSKFSYKKQMPIITSVKKDMKLSKDVKNEYINSKDGVMISAQLKNEDIIKDYSHIDSLKESILPANDSKITLRNILENTIKARILEDYNFYRSLNTYQTHHESHVLFGDELEIDVFLKRKSFISDVEVFSRVHDINGTIINKEFDVVLINAKVKGIVNEQEFKYHDMNSYFEIDLKELLSKALS